jgi:hypothetical protein
MYSGSLCTKSIQKNFVGLSWICTPSYLWVSWIFHLFHLRNQKQIWLWFVMLVPKSSERFECIRMSDTMHRCIHNSQFVLGVHFTFVFQMKNVNFKIINNSKTSKKKYSRVTATNYYYRIAWICIPIERPLENSLCVMIANIQCWISN